MKNSWLALLLVFAISVNAQENDKLKFYTIKDSTYSLWSKLPGSKSNPDWEEYIVDAAGDLFKIGTRYQDINRPMKLTSAGWVLWDKGIAPGNVTTLSTDGRGLIFASGAENRLYLLKDTAWKEVPTAASGYSPKPYPDGGLYRLRDQDGGDDTYYAKRKQIMRWSENGYQPCGANGKPLFLQRNSDGFMIDRKGRIYSYQDNPYGSPKGPVEVYIYENGDWKTIGKLPADITLKGFDVDNNLYVNGWDDQYKSYFKKWDGQAWTDIELPQGVELGTGIMFDEALNVYVQGKDKMNDHDQEVLFRYTQDGWKEVARGDKAQTISKFIPTTGDIYAVMWKDKTVQKFAGRWTVRHMEVADIPVDPKAKASPDLTYSVQKDLDKIKLFRKDGKIGVQDVNGGVRVHPVFDRIAFVKTPAHMLKLGSMEELASAEKFCLQMILAKDTAFVPIDQFTYGEPFPFQVKAFRKRITNVCGTCGGSGHIAERQVEVSVRGNYVRPKTSYSTSGENVWYPSCNCYVYTTTSVTQTSSGGYYEDKTETRTIPGGVCNACYGKGIYYAYELYEYDYTPEKGGFYVRKWR